MMANSGRIALIVLSLLVAATTGARAQAPPEVNGLAWCAAAQKDCLHWDAIPGALDYTVHSGDDRSLACVLDPGPDSCQMTLSATTTGSSAALAGNPKTGVFRWFLVTARNQSGMGSAGAASGGLRIVDSPTQCSDTSANGLSCAQQADCCGSICDEGTCCRDFGQACAVDANCCEATCTGGLCCYAGGHACTQGSQCCTGLCTGGFCMSPNGAPCGNGGCVPGNQCAGGLCCGDAYSACTPNTRCCQGSCDAATQRCCIPDGGFSPFCTGCCSAVCSGSICGRSCSPAGTSCSPSGPSGFCCNGCDASTRRCL